MRRTGLSGRMLGLISSAVVIFAGALAAPVSIPKDYHAATADGIAPSVMVGAGTERTEEDCPAADVTVAAADGIAGADGSGDTASGEPVLRTQTSMWISSMAEGLDKVQAAAAPEQPADSTKAQTLQTAAGIGSRAAKLIAENHTMSWQDYSTLLNIVEAECTGGDEKSKLLVADVILNRVRDEHFPDSVYDVVWQKLGGTAQFSPTQDGRMGRLEITDSTISAVNRAVDGEDISKGALFFMAREYSSESNVEWFDEKLTYLYSYGGHDFYKFK